MIRIQSATCLVVFSTLFCTQALAQTSIESTVTVNATDVLVMIDARSQDFNLTPEMIIPPSWAKDWIVLKDTQRIFRSQDSASLSMKIGVGGDVSKSQTQRHDQRILWRVWIQPKRPGRSVIAPFRIVFNEKTVASTKSHSISVHSSMVTSRKTSTLPIPRSSGSPEAVIRDMVRTYGSEPVDTRTSVPATSSGGSSSQSEQ